MAQTALWDRDLRSHLVDPILPAWLRETHEHVDEYLSTACENFLTHLLQEIDIHPQRRDRLSTIRSALTGYLAAEQAYQARVGYMSLQPSVEDPSYVFRRGLLKKFVMSVLFLEITKDTEGNRLFDVFAAIAAGDSHADRHDGGPLGAATLSILNVALPRDDCVAVHAQGPDEGVAKDLSPGK